MDHFVTYFYYKKISVYVVFIYTLRSASLGFEKLIQSYFSNEPKTEIVRVVSSKTRGGDLGKSGPGSRAKAAARRNFKVKGSGSSIIPGASGFTPQNVYHIYQESGRLAALQPKNDGVPPRIAPSVSPNRQSRIKSQPLRIKSKY